VSSFTFGSMSGSASVNLSKDKMHSNYDSVVEQTGIFAGKGGYDITVGEHTQLNGVVIGSTADKNRLNSGNTEGTTDTGGNTTVTPILDGPNKDDLAYLATGDKPASLSPEGSARAGAFRCSC
jgi:hypothetical protein